MPLPVFTSDDRPRDILNGAGEWLAAELGWRWVSSRDDVETRIGSRVLRLGLQSSKWSRGGVATWLTARVTVLDSVTPKWRVAHPDLTIFLPSDPPAMPFVYNSLLINIESDLYEFEASSLPQTAAGRKPLTLQAFAERFRSRVVPVLRLFESPAMVASGLPQSWRHMIDAWTIEWALACGDRDAARALLWMRLGRSNLDSKSRATVVGQFRTGWESAPDRGQRSAVPAWAVESLGWLAKVHDLVGRDELPPNA